MYSGVGVRLCTVGLPSGYVQWGRRKAMYSGVTVRVCAVVSPSGYVQWGQRKAMYSGKERKKRVSGKSDVFSIVCVIRTINKIRM